MLEGGGRVAAELTARRPPRSTPPIRSPASASGSCIARAGADLPRRQLARPAARVATRERLRGVRRRVGRPARLRLAGLDRRAHAGRRRARGGRARGAAGRGDGRRLDDRQPLQARARRRSTPTGCRPQGAVVTDRDNFPTDRYVLEGLADAARPRAADDRSTGRARSRRSTAPTAPWRSSCSRTSTYRSGALADMRGAHRRGAPLRRARGVGPLPLGRRGARRAARATASSWPSAAPTSTSTPVRARPPSCTRRRRCSRGCARRSGAGSGSATSSPWSARTTRWTASAGSWPARRRSLGLAAVEEGVQLTAEAGIEPAAREVGRAVRADRRAARRVAGAARLRARLAARRRRAGDRTCRSATPRRGRSAAR